MPACTLQLIGAGQLGRSLARLGLERGCLRVDHVVCRSQASAEAAVAFIGAGQPTTRPPPPRPGAVWLLAVPDHALPQLALDLAAQAAGFDGVTVFHGSGALSSDVLQPLRARGAAVASVHPLRSFADPACAVAAFAGTGCAVEGDAAALALLIPLFQALGGRCLPIDAAAKTQYHAAAVLASNYLVSLLEAALRLFEQAGIERALGLELLGPLSRGALDNVLRDGPAQALSGPILRGDVTTVERQLAALRASGLDGLYRHLGRVALDLARQRGQAKVADLARIEQLLTAAGPD